MLKLFIYGYLNRVQSSRRLEHEANRNKNFSKAKIKARLQLIDASIERYLGEIASTDRREGNGSEAKTERLESKIAALKEEIKTLKKLEVRMLATPDQKISQTDPDARYHGSDNRSFYTTSSLKRH